MPSEEILYTKIFKEICPYYLSIGMTWEQFWCESPYLTKYYREAEMLRMERRNQEMHLMGAYNLNAFRTVIDSFAWGLGGCKGARPKGYPEYPFAITEREKKAETERKRADTIKWFMEGQDDEHCN